MDPKSDCVSVNRHLFHGEVLKADLWDGSVIFQPESKSQRGGTCVCVQKTSAYNSIIAQWHWKSLKDPLYSESRFITDAHLLAKRYFDLLLEVMTSSSAPCTRFYTVKTAYVFIHAVNFELQQEPLIDISTAFIQGQVAKAVFKQNNKKGVRGIFLQTLLFPTFRPAEWALVKHKKEP